MLIKELFKHCIEQANKVWLGDYGLFVFFRSLSDFPTDVGVQSGEVLSKLLFSEPIEEVQKGDAVCPRFTWLKGERDEEY